MVGLSRKRVFPKTKGDSITGQDRAQKHCDFRFSQIEKKSKVAVLQLAQSHTFLEIDHEIISTVILLPSAESFKKGDNYCRNYRKISLTARYYCSFDKESKLSVRSERVAGQLGLKSSRPLSQVGPGSTWPGVFSECPVTYMISSLFCIIFPTKQ